MDAALTQNGKCSCCSTCLYKYYRVSMVYNNNNNNIHNGIYNNISIIYIVIEFCQSKSSGEIVAFFFINAVVNNIC